MSDTARVTRAPRATFREVAGDRLEIARLVPRAGRLLTAGVALVNLVAGLLPVIFVVATSLMIGRVPAAVRGGLHSGAWHSLLAVFAVAAAAFVVQQIVAPLATSLRARGAPDRRAGLRQPDDGLAAKPGHRAAGRPGVAR